MSLINRLIGGRYQVCAKIGEGGMAVVYRAKDIRTDHQVAIKVLRPEYINDREFLSRFEREALAASKVEHHNIVNLLDVGEDDGLRYLVMEYVGGKTLKEIITEKGPLPPETAAQIALRILSALQHAHDNGIIHRDIKPQNILVHENGMIKVADFGIARIAGSGTLSEKDTVVGSVHYFSPEQANGSVATVSSDIYSVGVVLYEMLTGHVPFDGESSVAIAMQHIHTPPPPMSHFVGGIGPAMEYVVGKALQKDKALRYQSARDMAQDLCRATEDPSGTWLHLGQEPTPANKNANERRQQSGRYSRKERNRKKNAEILGIMLLTVFVLCVLCIGGYMLYDRIANMTEVPDVMGETEERAIAMIQRVGLLPSVSYVNHTTSAGTVISQMPDSMTSKRKNSTVLITVSKGPQVSTAPNLMGKLLDDANVELQNMNLPIAFEDARAVSDAPIGTILAQTPAEGEELPLDRIIHVTVSGGSVVVPGVEGMLLSAGTIALTDAQLQVGNIIYRCTTTLLENDIIFMQSIKSGTSVITQTRVALIVNTLDTPTNSAAVVLSLPEVTEDKRLRVTVLEADGREFIRHESVIVPGQGTSTTVTLASQSVGKLGYRVYINEVLSYEGAATFE